MKKLNKTIGLSLLGAFIAFSAHATSSTGGDYISTTQATYVEPSVTRKLVPGQKIFNLVERYRSGEVIIQRLTDKAYWMGTDQYATVAYIGREGVLLMDPLGWGKGSKILKAIKTITRKPVTAVIYSHQHRDHIDDIGVFLKEAANGRKLRIIASDKTHSILKNSRAGLPLATEVISFNNGTTTFEDQTIKVVGFSPAAHSTDSAVWLLVEDKIAHAPDVYNPDQIHYRNFGMSQTYDGYRDNLETIRSLDWNFFSGGHGNIGGKKDLDFIITFTKDLEAALKIAIKKQSPRDSNQKVINGVMKHLRVKYGKYYGFERSLPSQIRMALRSLTK